ncbi:unnamed protein product [Polarella glacialis]|uniref:Uncharacterized protein n=1 Tax=Polarella glacialis TaxID=89957 RepID=A0A813I6V8_POLGL|nr:unnamed protein product [Polarella glacialis]
MRSADGRGAPPPPQGGITFPPPARQKGGGYGGKGSWQPPPPRESYPVHMGKGSSKGTSFSPSFAQGPSWSVTGLPGGGPSKRLRYSEDPSNVDTVASVGAAEAGVDQDNLQAFYESQPGFVVFKANPRMGGGFAKFSSAHMAAQAVGAAEAEGIPAAMAKPRAAWPPDLAPGNKRCPGVAAISAFAALRCVV